MAGRATTTQALRAAEKTIGARPEGTRVRIGKSDQARVAPWEFRDAVASFGRRFGGGGDLVWVPEQVVKLPDGTKLRASCSFWQVRLTLLPGDPRLKGRDGDVFETVELHYWVDPRDPKWAREPNVLKRLRRDRLNRLMPGYVAYELDELGVLGLTELLERGSTLSGRGEFKGSQQAVTRMRERHRDHMQRLRSTLQREAGYKAVDARRRILKIPFLRVGIELRSSTQKEAPVT